jgi:hypothetical protein
MDVDGQVETPKTSPQQPSGRVLGILRIVALIAVVAGSVGSVGLMLNAGRNTPHLLLVLFVIWVLSPFAALAWANVVSKRWSVPIRAALYCVTFVIVLGSLAIYGDVLVIAPQGSANAFRFVITPPVSWLLLVIVVSIAALVSGGLFKRGTDA